MRRENDTNEWLVIVANFTPNTHGEYKVGVPVEGFYKEIFNSDSSRYGGSNKGNMGGKETIKYNIHDYQNALELALPPLSVSIFKHQSKNKKAHLN